MTPTQLRAYATIVRLGTSKAAAAELGISEAAVSGHVAALRRELDDVLFERTAAGLSLTPGGLRLATRAVELLGLQEQTRQEVRSASNGRRVLRLAVSALFGEYAAPGLIELFSTRARDLDVEMSVHDPARFGALLATRAVDVAIGPRAAMPEGVTSAPFLRYQLVLVAAPGHELARRRATPADLAVVTWNLGPSVLDHNSLAARMLSQFKVSETGQRIFQSHAAALLEVRARGVAPALAQQVTTELTDRRLARVEGPGSQADGVWAVHRLAGAQAPPAAAELARFVSTPRATQAMLTGSGANISHFRPHVHVTLWS